MTIFITSSSSEYQHAVDTALHSEMLTDFHMSACSMTCPWASVRDRSQVLKYTYLGGKQNKRIDSLLNALFKIARDERVQKCSKGKSTHRIVDINKRHEKALDLLNWKAPQPLRKIVTVHGRCVQLLLTLTMLYSNSSMSVSALLNVGSLCRAIYMFLHRLCNSQHSV